MAHTHLDSYDNFFVQLHGRKRFLLFEPEQVDQPNSLRLCVPSLTDPDALWSMFVQARHLHPYPFLHPSYAQAQVRCLCIIPVSLAQISQLCLPGGH